MSSPDTRLDDHERRIGALERSDIRREQIQSTLVTKVDRIETVTLEQTRTLDRIDGGMRFLKWIIPGVAVVVPALWWLFQHLPR